MNRYQGRGNREDVALLSVDELIRLAADRGMKIWTETTRLGRIRLTDGKNKLLLSRLFPGDLMPPEAVAAAVLYFFGDEALAFDFAMDPKPED